MKTTLASLTKAASAFGYSVEDDRENTTLYIHAPEGKAWEGGELHSLVFGYGSGGSYLPAWRQEAIQDATERLAHYPPSDLVDDL